VVISTQTSVQFASLCLRHEVAWKHHADTTLYIHTCTYDTEDRNMGSINTLSAVIDIIKVVQPLIAKLNLS